MRAAAAVIAPRLAFGCAFGLAFGFALGAGGVAYGAKGLLSVAPSAPAPEARAAAKAHFWTAQRLFQQDQFAEAEREYKAAYEAWPLEGFFFNIAQCERNQGHVEEAIVFFERYLGSPKAEEHRAEVEALLVELRGRVQAPAITAPAPTISSPSATLPALPATAPAGPLTAPPPVAAPWATPSTSAVVPATAPVLGTSASSAPVNATPSTSPLVAAAAEAPPDLVGPVLGAQEAPVYRKSWFWVAAGAAVVVVAAVVAVTASTSSQVPSGSLGTADWR